MSQKTHYTRVRQTAHLIDYFILRARRYRLVTQGLSLIDENALTSAVLSISQAGSISEGIYEWPQRLASFLRSQILPQRDVLLKLVETYGFLENGVIPGAENLTDLSDEEILLSRAWMFHRGVFTLISAEPAWRTPNTRLLLDFVFADGVLVKPHVPVPRELMIGTPTHPRREHDVVPVRRSTGCLSRQELSHYVARLRTLRFAATPANRMNAAAWSVLDDGLVSQLSGPRYSRYRSLPTSVALFALRNAIEYSLMYGDDLVTTYLNVVKASRDAGKSFRSFVESDEFESHVTPKAREMGIRQWALNGAQPASNGQFVPRPPGDFLGDLRSNRGLFECLRVLYGSVWIVLGALSARREGELLDLIAGKCLVSPGPYLRFHNRKSGPLQTREVLIRPIPEICARLIRMLERVKLGLVELGVLDSPGSLLLRPTYQGTKTLSTPTKGLSRGDLDCFCDYFRVATDSQGRRFYIRSHQLRRFFAMMFFWSSSFGGLDTLRWFLGHTDLSHVYQYISETTPGAVLRSVKAEFVVETMKSHTDSYEALRALIREKYGTDDFSLLDSHEVSTYIEYLVEHDDVQVEPEFFFTPQGESFRVVVTVCRQTNDAKQ